MKPTNRFHHDRTATALTLLEGANRLKVDVASFGGELVVEVELHAALAPDDAGAIVRSLIGQLQNNAKRDKEEKDRSDRWYRGEGEPTDDE